MAIPRRISFLEESRSRGIANLHSSGVEEYEIYSSGSSGNFRGMSYPKSPDNPPKIQKNLEKKNQKKFQPWIYISKFRMLGNNTKNWLVIQKNKSENWKILTNFQKIFSFFPYLSAKKGISVFSRSSANFGEDSRSRGVIKSIPRGIEEWKKVRDLEDRGTRNSSCHP